MGCNVAYAGSKPGNTQEKIEKGKYICQET